jgi:hypothetical protein
MRAVYQELSPGIVRMTQFILDGTTFPFDGPIVCAADTQSAVKKLSTWWRDYRRHTRTQMGEA